MAREQPSLFAGIPPKVFKDPPPARPSMPSEVERALVELAPHIPPQSQPRFFKNCVEVATVKGHVLNKLLRRAGFEAHKHSLVEGIWKDFEWVFWRREWK